MTDTKTLIDGLNQDLSREYQAMIMYNTYAAAVTGPHRKEIADFFRAEIPDEQDHAQFLADKICALGGLPVATPMQVALATNLRGMLESAWQAEKDTIDHYAERRGQASTLGDHGLVSDLENIISEETKHMEELGKMIAGF